MKRSFVFLFLLLLGSGCQMASPPPPPPVAAPASEQRWGEKLQQQATTLPGAQVTSAAGSLTIAYPQESLFSIGSVLPLAGGAEVLDPLAALLAAYPQAVWDGKVRAATANGSEYDLTLAQKRRDLLQRYFHQGGVGNDQVIWQANGGDGPPLELTLRPPQPLPVISPGVKE